MNSYHKQKNKCKKNRKDDLSPAFSKVMSLRPSFTANFQRKIEYRLTGGGCGFGKGANLDE